MLSTSFEFRRTIARNSKTVNKAVLTLADGTALQLTGTDFMAGGTFSEAVSSQSSFDVGAAIIGRHSFTLRNDDSRFDGYDFAGSVIEPYIGVELPSGTVEWLRKGVFGIEQPRTYGNTIGLSALDNMRLLEVPYSDVSTMYPASLGLIAYDICTACGMALANQAFANSSVVVDKRPDDSCMTCLDMISYVAQASGNWAKCDTLGRLCFDWYDTGAFEDEDWLDGDRFDGSSPYSSGDAADGGAFMSGGSSYDGGAFSGGRFWHVFAFSELSVMTDDVVITGVRVTAQDQISADGTKGNAGETHLYGTEGYVLEVSGNPLIPYGSAQAAASRIGLRAVGMRFRPFSASAIGNPAIEAGDPVILTDRKQNLYRSYITTTTFRSGAYQALACGAETPSRNSATGYSALTKAIVETRRFINAEKSARELAIERLQEVLDSSGGLYKTEEEQEDESIVYYLHDKPTLAESEIVWKLAAEVFGVSTDGVDGPYLGFDAWGNAILSAIYAIGINANYVDTGMLRSRNGLIAINLDTGVITINNGKSIATTDLALLDADLEYRLSDSATELTGSGTGYTWSTTAPEWVDGAFMWQRTKTTYIDGEIAYSQPTCVSGARGQTGIAGLNQATVMLYQRAATAPQKPNSTLTYTFATSILSGNMGSWGMGIPAGSDPCWVIAATASSNAATDTIASSEWSDAVKLVENGANGQAGLNQATVFLFARSRTWRPAGHYLVAPNASAFSVSGNVATVKGSLEGNWIVIDDNAPAKPSASTIYDFSSGVLSPIPSGWSREIPSGYDACWVTTAVAISGSGTDTIAASEWADVVKLAEDGTSATVIGVAYAVSMRGDEPPSTGWQSSVPVVARGMWLWAETTYSDNTVVYNCSYVGTDGEDGSSVAIQSVSKADGVTTIVLADTDGSTKTLEIADGEDGRQGIPGLKGYTHIAWANSADGETDFSTSVSAGKTYVGMYADNTAADSSDYRDYSWSLIKGADGRGVSVIVEQYYLSTSNSSLVGGTWSESQPTWASGCYIWTRSKITWSDGTTTYTTAQLANGLNQANQEAAKANAIVRNYGAGALVCREGNTVGALVNADGSFDIVAVSWSNGVPTAGSVLGSFKDPITLGSSECGLEIGSGLISLLLEGEIPFQVAYTPPTTTGGTDSKITLDFMLGLIRAQSDENGNLLQSIGKPLLMKDGDAIKYWDGNSSAPATPATMGDLALSKLIAGTALTVGSRASGTIGNYSISAGTNNLVSGNWSAAFGYDLSAIWPSQAVFGSANVTRSDAVLIVGIGQDANLRKNAFYVKNDGSAWLSGTLTQNSDRRLKKHIAYLGEDACEFVRNLKPVLFSRSGVKHLGFYAQDVQDADAWGTGTVSSEQNDSRISFATLSLDYTALIAPLVAYAQSLERRVKALEERVGSLGSALAEVAERLEKGGL